MQERKISEKSMALLKKIEDVMGKIEKRRPLNQDELRAIRKWFTVSYTYHTNAIEGNTLTLQETKLILEDGITVGGKPLREIFEASNHQKTLFEVYEHIEKKDFLSEDMVLYWHKILMENILEKPGKYRDIQVYISDSEEKLPSADKVHEMMKSFFKEYSRLSADNIFLRAIWLHWNIAKIHPFIDGNGRIARLLLNFELLSHDIFPVIIPLIRRPDYINSFSSFSYHIELMLDIIHENAKDYWRIIEE